jgi:hypothetical protein
VHRIFYHPNTLVGHPNITQTIGAERITLLHTLLAHEARGDTLAWVVDVYYIVGIHCLLASQEVSLHPEASQHLPQHFTQHSIERLFEVYKTEIEWLLFLPCSILLKFAI